MKFSIIIGAIFCCSNIYSQECEIYEIEGVPSYFYVTHGEKSVSKINDSLFYTIEIISEEIFRVEKLIKDHVVKVSEYCYNGKSQYKSFKVKKRKFGKVVIVTEKRMTCMLEKIE
jgi:hypothetical protein